MERESLRGLWKRCITCVFVQNFGFVSQPTGIKIKPSKTKCSARMIFLGIRRKCTKIFLP